MVLSPTSKFALIAFFLVHGAVSHSASGQCNETVETECQADRGDVAALLQAKVFATVQGATDQIGPATCDQITTPCSGATPVNKGSGTSCTGDAASCDAATCCEASATCDQITTPCSGATPVNQGSGTSCTGDAASCDAAICCQACVSNSDCSGTPATPVCNTGTGACEGTTPTTLAPAGECAEVDTQFACSRFHDSAGNVCECAGNNLDLDSRCDIDCSPSNQGTTPTAPTKLAPAGECAEVDTQFACSKFHDSAGNVCECADSNLDEDGRCDTDCSPST